MNPPNKFNLPEPFVVAVSSDRYVRGDADFTTTELVAPVRIRSLLQKHKDEIEEDVSDRLWALMGQSKHVVLENIAREKPERYLVEERFTATLPGGVTVSGRIDLFDKETGILYDWKDASVWKFIMGDTREWEQQSNINLYLMRKNDIVVKELKNICFLKDWKARMARTTAREDYPQCAVNVVNLPMWSVGEQEAFILARVAAHVMGREAPPVCTKGERWQRDAVWAVKKKGRKRALRLMDTKDRAWALQQQLQKGAGPGEKFEIEERPSEPVRCLDFCPVWKWCDYGQEARKKWEQQDLFKEEESAA